MSALDSGVVGPPASPAAGSQRLPAGTRLGEVVLAVTDLDRSLDFWTRVLGLHVVAERGLDLQLGAGDRPLVILVPGAAAPVMDGRTGLYHVALHFERRAEFARALARLLSHRWPVSPTDHLETEAIYLWDPDGNGIELTFETPGRGHLVEENGRFVARTADGRLHSGREPLDVRGVLADLPGDMDPIDPIPGGVRVGHVHLHVASLAGSLRFYRDVIGFRENMDMPAIGMADLHLDDSVPHALAVNTWAGRGAPPPPADAAGLRSFTLELPSVAAVDELAGRLRDDGRAFERRGVPGAPDTLELADPSANRLRVRVVA